MFNKLYVIPSFLGEDSPCEVIPLQVVEILKNTDYFVVEKEKTFRKFIKKILPNKKQSELSIFQIDKHSDNILTENLKIFIKNNIKNYDIGLCSEAGTPCIADPGKDIVSFCSENNIHIVPLVGPSSIILSLMASGLNGQNFAFNGYLPIDKNERKNKLLELEKKITKENQTQIFIETPYRNDTLLREIINTCSNYLKLCIATNITLPEESIKTKEIKSWKKQNISINKKPTIFLMGN